MTTSARPSSGGEASQDPLFAWSSEDSPASPFPTQAGSSRRKTSGGSGPRSRSSFASYDPDGCCWRTSRVSVHGEWETFSATWPRAGMTRSGTAFPLWPSAPLTAETESLSWPTPAARLGDPKRGMPSPESAAHRLFRTGRRNLEDAVAIWPTPRATDGDRGGRGDLLAMVRTGRPSGRKAWATPRASDGRCGPDYAKAERGRSNPRGSSSPSLPTQVGGQLNPTWVEWLMGFPIGWTELPPSGMPSSPKSPSTSDV